MIELRGAGLAANFDLQGRMHSLRVEALAPPEAELLPAPALFCRLALDGKVLPLQSCQALPGGRPAGQPSGQAGLRLVYPGAEVRLTAGETGLGWELQTSLSGLQACFPALGGLFDRDDRWPPLREAGSRPLFRSSDWLLPVCRRITPERSLTFLSGAPFPLPVDYPEALWSAPGLALAGGLSLAGQGFSAELRFHPGAWREAFDLFRQAVRSRFNLAEYRREDTAWYQNQWVQHFTFLYGSEILNLQTGRLELDRLLNMGQREFGGLDGLLAWGGYPRLGIDQRTQWDFYDDLPGGRAGLRDLGRQARTRGVRLFLPYLPWDQASEDSPDLQVNQASQASQERHAAELARLLVETEADGVFLDTLSGIGREFREAIDRLRPGVVFCSEGRARPESLELVTGSWSETSLVDIRQGNWSAAPEKMPDLILLRFLFPEHRIFIGARHASGEDRLVMLERGFFNGVGWMVWQDIFGLPLPYTPEAARRLQTYSRVWRENHSALAGPAPTPLVETLHPSVFANEFPGPAKRLWTIFNTSGEVISGRVLPIQPRPDSHMVELFSNQAVPLQQGALALHMPPGGLAAVVELPSLLECSGARLRLNAGPEEASLELLRGAERESVPISSPELDLTPLLRRFGQPHQLRLFSRGELLDQIPFHPQRS